MVGLESPNPSGICQCGCGLRAPLAAQTHRRLGHVRGEPVRFIRGHVGHLKSRSALTSDLWTVEDRGYETLCWIWNGAPRNGYGRVRIRGRTQLPHRVMYEQEIGPIPAGFDVDHLCSQRLCVCPSHLEAVTRAENIRRSRTARLTQADVDFIRASSLTQKSLATLYGVDQSHISRIRSGDVWKND